MPEKCKYCTIPILTKFLLLLFTAGTILTVIVLWINSTGSEQQQATDTCAKAGLIHLIDASSPHIFEQNKVQTCYSSQSHNKPRNTTMLCFYLIALSGPVGSLEQELPANPFQARQVYLSLLTPRDCVKWCSSLLERPIEA